MGKPFEIHKEIPLTASTEAVWAAIATEPGLAGWFMPMEIDPKSPTVKAHEPGRQLSVRLPEGPDGSFHAFEYRIDPIGEGGAVLHFEHSGLTSDGWGEDYETVTSAGWDMYLHTLDQYLTHFAGRPALYLEAEGPPESADPATWPRLIAGLGLSLTEPVKEGTAVRFDLAGFGPVEGTVDYIAPPFFLGLRAPHALIRFHGRFPSGMPVAVSQHTYLETFDGDAAQRAWEAWLAGVFA